MRKALVPVGRGAEPGASAPARRSKPVALPLERRRIGAVRPPNTGSPVAPGARSTGRRPTAGGSPSVARAPSTAASGWPEADAPHRDVRADRFAEQPPSRRQPRVGGVLVRAHRAAHDDDRGELAASPAAVALVQLERASLRVRAARRSSSRGGRGLARDVLKREQRRSIDERTTARPPANMGAMPPLRARERAQLARQRLCLRRLAGPPAAADPRRLARPQRARSLRPGRLRGRGGARPGAQPAAQGRQAARDHADRLHQLAAPAAAQAADGHRHLPAHGHRGLDGAARAARREVRRAAVRHPPPSCGPRSPGAADTRSHAATTSSPCSWTAPRRSMPRWPSSGRCRPATGRTRSMSGCASACTAAARR